MALPAEQSPSRTGAAHCRLSGKGERQSDCSGVLGVLPNALLMVGLRHVARCKDSLRGMPKRRLYLSHNSVPPTYLQGRVALLVVRNMGVRFKYIYLCVCAQISCILHSTLRGGYS